MALDQKKLKEKLNNAVGEKADVIFQKVKEAYEKNTKGKDLQNVLDSTLESEGITTTGEIKEISMMTRAETE